MSNMHYEILYVLDILASMMLSLSIMIYVVYKITKGK